MLNDTLGAILHIGGIDPEIFTNTLNTVGPTPAFQERQQAAYRDVDEIFERLPEEQLVALGKDKRPSFTEDESYDICKLKFKIQLEQFQDIMETK